MIAINLQKETIIFTRANFQKSSRKDKIFFFN